MHPLRADLPIYLGAEGPKNVALAAEIADGWLPMFFSPKSDGFYRDALAEGFAASERARTRPTTSRSRATVPVIIDDDVEAAADFVRPMLALYIGGMGAREVELPRRRVRAHGLRGRGEQIQELYLDGQERRGDRRGADARWSRTSRSIGPQEKIRDDLAAWRATVVTTMLVGGAAANAPPHRRARARVDAPLFRPSPHACLRCA